MYIEAIPNRNSAPAVLLRECFRENGKIRKRTLANLSCLSDAVIEGLKVLLRGAIAVASIEEDRGMLTSACIEQVLQPQAMGWVNSLRAPAIAHLAAEQGPFQPSLFDERNVLENRSEHFPGERLVVCRNPALAQERARKRIELLQATEAVLAKVAAATQRARRPLRGEQAIALRVARVIERWHMGKHIELSITEDSLDWMRKVESIAGGRTRWAVRHPHQRQRRAARRGGGSDRLQEPVQRGARIPLDEDGGSVRAVGISLHRPTRSRSRVPVHAGLLRAVAYA
ncbi:MAG TPA: hypothetical protein PKN13_01525 [Accumulibacter sp.]|nr:hypothetical protein [Accumulibacter sp.]HMW16489.1 hypothetical protein [Accumulibacter sp.]HMX22199.1 hypothetical protein [Accumulibacter sp.]HMY06255.1 hypothetical protein [Accumulibacter sp.]HNC16842.1 hypothetical protein [Accumulibacter sp.]